MHWQDACKKSDLSVAFRVNKNVTMFRYSDGYGTVKRGKLPIREARMDEIEGWMDWAPYIMDEEDE